MKFSVVSHFPNDFLLSQGKLCISIYQPTDPLQKGGGPSRIDFKNAIKELFDDPRLVHQEAIKAQLNSIEQDTLLWSFARNAIAIFCTPDECQLYHLNVPVEKLSYIGESFLIIPLIKYFKSDRAFQVMVLGKEDFLLYNGSRQGLKEINLDEESTSFKEIYSDFDPASSKFRNKHGGGRLSFISRSGEVFSEDRETAKYFHKVDRFINQILDKQQPLFVVAQPKQTAMFKSISVFPKLINVKENLTWNTQSEKQLLDQILSLIKEHNEEKLDDRIAWVHQMLAAGKYSDQEDYLLDENNRPLFNMMVVSNDITPTSLKIMNQEVINTLVRNALETQLEMVFLDSSEFFTDSPIFTILHIPLNRKE